MKTHPLLLLLLAFASVLPAQDKPKDPFVKGRQQEAPADKAKAEPVPTPQNVLCLLETFTLPQSEYLAWLDAPDGRGKLYEQTLAAVKGGAARLDGCHFLANKSGTRSVLEGVDELVYPTEWTTPDSTGFQYPTAVETRVLGDRLELEPILQSDGKVLAVTHSFLRDVFLGFHLFKADATLPGLPLPRFYGQEGPASCAVTRDVPCLLSTFSSPQPGNITLVFATFKVVDVEASATPGSKGKGQGNVVLTARVVSMDRAQGWQLLQKHSHDAPALLTMLKPMIEAKTATLEHISTTISQSGSRVAHQSGTQVNYGTGFHPPTELLTAERVTALGRPSSHPNAAGVASMEMRSLGFRWETDSIISADGTLVDTQIDFSNTLLAGSLKDKNWNERYPQLEVFSNQQITTALTLEAGSTALLGTLSPPGETGVNERKDTGRLWLVFLQAEVE